MGFGLLFVPWLLGGGGMGDVKLLAALGAWLGSVVAVCRLCPEHGNRMRRWPLSCCFAMLPSEA